MKEQLLIDRRFFLQQTQLLPLRKSAAPLFWKQPFHLNFTLLPPYDPPGIFFFFPFFFPSPFQALSCNSTRVANEPRIQATLLSAHVSALLLWPGGPHPPPPGVMTMILSPGLMDAVFFPPRLMICSSVSFSSSSPSFPCSSSFSALPPSRFPPIKRPLSSR